MLIFSQWTQCLNLIECLLNHIKLPFFRLDGSTPIKDRQTMIDQFNSDPSTPVFLLRCASEASDCEREITIYPPSIDKLAVRNYYLIHGFIHY